MVDAVKKEIAARLVPFVGGDPEAGRLLALAVGPALLRVAGDGGDWRSQATQADLRTVSSWISGSLDAGSAWLRDVDSSGRPTLLAGFRSVADAVAVAARAADREVSARIEDVLDSLECVRPSSGEDASGWLLSPITTKTALKKRSSHLRHRMGREPGEFERFSGHGHAFLSLSDRGGRALATLRVHDGTLLDFACRADAMPDDDALAAVRECVRQNGWTVLAPASRLWHAVDVDGLWHAFDELPKGLNLQGDLDLTGLPVTRLPVDLDIGGSLLLAGTYVTEVPDGTRIGGDLSLHGTLVESLPERLWISGNLSIHDTPFDRLPARLHVGGNMNLSGTGIDELPDALTVGGMLRLRGLKGLTELPSDLRVGGMIDIRDTGVLALPKGVAAHATVLMDEGSFSVHAARMRLNHRERAAGPRR